MAKKSLGISYFHCTDCKSVTPLPRNKRAREKYHKKHIWCYNCKKEVMHIEERVFDFKIKESIGMLYELAQQQRNLMEFIKGKHDLTRVNMYENRKLSLMVELGELANELNFFKVWKKNPKPNFSVPCKSCGGYGRIAVTSANSPGISEHAHECVFCDGTGSDTSVNPALEEYVDGIHFLLEAAIEHCFTEDDLKELLYGAEEQPLQYTNLLDQFNTLYFEISKGLNSRLDFILRLYLGVAKMVGFSYEDIKKEYYKKNKVNLERQANGY